MKKIHIVRKSTDFERMIHKNQPYKYKDYIIFLEHKENSVYQFGLSVGKKIGNAVIRNRIRRQLKDIIDQKNYQNDFNCIIIVGRGILNRSYDEMKDNLYLAFNRLNILKEKENEE